jgi:hypothetical protein
MTKVISLRLPAALERAVRGHAVHSRMTVPEIVRVILMHAPEGQYNFAVLPDVPQRLDAKLDVRLPEELVSRLRAESARLGISVSVYSRVIFVRLLHQAVGSCRNGRALHTSGKS